MIVRRGGLTDHYVEDERSVVMVDESVLGLSPIATAILEAVPEGVDVGLPTVTQHVVATFGPPAGTESAEALTEQQVWDLVAHRVLVVVEGEGSRDRTSSLLDHRSDADALEPEGAAAVAALRDALRHLRSDDERRWVAPASLSQRGLVDAAHQHHVVPYLSANLDRLDISAQAKSELEVAAGRQYAGAAVLAADLSAVMDSLRAAGVRALAVKGVALAAQAYGDYSIRGAGDLDLLVPPEELACAHQALLKAGWKAAAGYPVPGSTWAWRHLVRTGHELTLVGSHSEIDLHWHLAPTRTTFPDFEVLWGRRATVSVAGHPTPTLSPYDALTHSAGHAAKDEWRWLRSLLDVHALMADGDTWGSVDRPFRADQLVTIGLAAREFGVPAGAPEIVCVAARQINDALLARVHRRQDETAPEHRPLVVGLNFLHRLRVIRLTGGSVAESVRLVSRSALPPWVTADLDSPSAVLAIPSALGRRALDATRKLQRRR